jgi:peptidoglycan hydrolase-like protein with peptidoglycan-binding domain
MQLRSAAPLVLAVLVLLFAPASGHAARGDIADPSAGWHGRAIQDPQPRPELVRTSWPEGWSAGAVGPGTGYVRPGGSRRVREVQRRLRRLGYRPGPVDGLFGPRTRAATRWFQFKHGFKPTGHVNRSTLTVLRARSQHRPLGTERREPQPAAEPPASTPPPLAAPAKESGPSPLLVPLLLIALALGLGIIAGLLGPELLPRRTAPPTPAQPALEPAPVPAVVRRPRTPPQVLGYMAVEPESEQADTATAAIALRCAHRGWSLIEVINDETSPGRRLAERPGLVYAVRSLRSGPATGLVVARLRDVMPRMADLATLLKWLADADAFLGAVDHELDTSTRTGRATARAVVELGAWDRRRIDRSTREDLASGRFAPRAGVTHSELARQIATMLHRGSSMRAIADALNLTGVPGPRGRARWQPADVRSAAEEVRHT